MRNLPMSTSASQPLGSLVSIGITTKNRWQDLQVTLAKIVEFGLQDLPILIFDDGSDQPCPFDLSNFALKIRLRRFEQSQGLIIRRNQLAEAITTKYYLSLDDDSFPVAGSLQAAIDFAEAIDNLLCLAFPIYNPIQQEYQSQSQGIDPYQVRFFVGCGHLLNRANFLNLGGYCEELIHQGEEMELGARAFQSNFACYHFPQFEIHHVISHTSRSWYRMDFYGARNNVLWNDWFVPGEVKWVKQSRTLLSRLILSARVRRLGQIRGEIAGFRDINKYKGYRQSMTLNRFREWQRLPEH
jgi:GT2 family glycosyltransferase